MKDGTKLIIAIALLAIAGVAVAWQMGMFSGGGADEGSGGAVTTGTGGGVPPAEVADDEGTVNVGNPISKPKRRIR